MMLKMYKDKYKSTRQRSAHAPSARIKDPIRPAWKLKNTRQDVRLASGMLMPFISTCSSSHRFHGSMHCISMLSNLQLPIDGHLYSRCLGVSSPKLLDATMED